MEDELIEKLNAVSTALNDFNKAFRDVLSSRGIRTTENYFQITENKALLDKLQLAEETELVELLGGHGLVQ